MEFAVVHSIQGRVRLRLPSTAVTTGLVDAVRALQGVTAATWNPRTRGLLVHYDAGATTPAAVVEAVTTHAGLPAPSQTEAGNEPLPVAIASSVRNLNGRIAQATGGRLDLAVLVPLALTVWAVRELLRAQVAPLAWSSALWYAHGLFRDYVVQERP